MFEKQKKVYFIINLLQDINVVRGLVYLTVRETDAGVGFLVSEAFLKRDERKIWQSELNKLAAEVGASLNVFGAVSEAFAILQGSGGMIIAASESNLNAHWQTHDVLRIAPPSYLRVTLQHGFECVGFKQSREHVIAHGRNISFASDIICSWFDPEALTAVTAAERSKVYVSGPPSLLLAPTIDHQDHPPLGGGLVCENLHSVRLRATGDHKASFMDIFFEFCTKLAQRNSEVTLRPHPGGQYVLKNNISLPDNVRLNNLPMYNVDLKGYAYGISAPSTVVFDMVLAGIPVGVWRDPNGVMDAGNYSGLTEISTIQEWLAFERDARLRPDMLIERQTAFLRKLSMPTDPEEVYRRFARLLVSGTSSIPELTTRPIPDNIRTAKKSTRFAPKRVLFLANGNIPTLQLSFLKPLSPMFETCEMQHLVVTGAEIKEKFQQEWNQPAARDWLLKKIDDFSPDVIVCCRYSAPHAKELIQYGKDNEIPIIFHVDDDLLNIPREIGEKKYRDHNHPSRIKSVTELLKGADLRYFSTQKLKDRFRNLNFYGPSVSGKVYCAAKVLRKVSRGPVRKIGYMGFDHARDLDIALPAIETYMQLNPDVSFELFGSIPLPESLQKFGSRVVEIAPVRDYQSFLRALAERKWDIGICPLTKSPFNEVKANTKWVEYTACGMATVASAGLVYDECASNGRGILVNDRGWFSALQSLTDDAELRYQIADTAQQHLKNEYSESRLLQQVLDVFDLSKSVSKNIGMTKVNHL